MESGIIKITKLRSFSHTLKVCFPVRASSNVPNLKKEEEDKIAVPSFYPRFTIQYWNEKAALKKQRKAHGLQKSLATSADFLRLLQSLNDAPLSFSELYKLILKRWKRKDLLNQRFLAQREMVLKPELAAAHFIIARGGSVKFLGQPQWVGINEEIKTLPFNFVPGYHVEAIKAENTNLCYEGLENMRKLKYITYLSLKGLEDVNDWCLDWISKEYYATLEDLDISHCVNVTYRGFSCFYRFECLKSLNLEGVPESPELKLACLMLLEIKPNLEIKGIELDIPEKIEPVDSEGTKLIQEETKLISEETKLISEEMKNVPEETRKVSKI